MKLVCQRCGHRGSGDLEFVWFSETFQVQQPGAAVVDRTLWLCPDCASSLGSNSKCVAFLRKQLKA
jgi:hypothetical protein